MKREALNEYIGHRRVSALSPQEESETFRKDIHPGNKKYNHEGTLKHDNVLLENDASHFLPQAIQSMLNATGASE